MQARWSQQSSSKEPARESEWPRIASPTRAIGLDDWLLAGLLGLVIGVPVYATQRSGWAAGAEVLWPIVLAALLIGWVSARWPAWLGLPLGILSGAGYVFLECGEVLPYVRSLDPVSASIDLAWQLAGGPVAHVLPPGDLSLPDYFRQSALNAGLFCYRLSSWLQSAVGGRTSTDNAIFVACLGIIAWLIALWASWCVYRLQHAALAVLPAGVALVAVSVNTRGGFSEIIVFSFAALLLGLRVNLRRMRVLWDRRGIDYAEDVEWQLAFLALLAVACLTFLAAMIPSATTNPASESFWTAFRGPWSQVEATVNRVFAGVQRTNVGSSASGGQVVLGGSIETAGTNVVFLLRTDEPPPLPSQLLGHLPAGEMPPPSKHYVRALTFDSYGGLQWRRQEGTKTQRAANELVTLGADTLPGKRVEQSLEIVAPRSPTVLGMNEPISVDAPYQVEGDEEDITALSLDRIRSRYRVVSIVPQPTQRQLREAGTNYPRWVQRYLALPDLPRRVIDLARELTGQAPTAYDQAEAIQNYLRRMNYSAEVVPPPEGRDAVDYFLFDGKKGYCDYFASAMVVMLRSRGVPARLATGYALGEYDEEQHAYVARERDSHSWPEVYFPGIGWVEFEPTPSNPVIIRPEDERDALLPVPNLEDIPASQPQASPSWQLQFPVWWLSPLGFATLILGVYQFLAWQSSRLSAGEYARRVYAQLCLYAGWLGVRRRPNQTPYEYGRELERRLRGQLGVAVAHVCDLYVRGAYSRRSLSPRQREELARTWRWIRWRLWRLRWPPSSEPGRTTPQ